jgi:beta-lactamase class A
LASYDFQLKFEEEFKKRTAIMRSHLSRRAFTQMGFGGLALGACSGVDRPSLTSTELAALEGRSGGRLGVAMFEPSTRRMASYLGQTRFAMASTFKLALAAVILRQADQGNLSLDMMLPITEADLAGHSPVVRENLPKGQMTIGELAKAAQVTSDNAATNILLRHLGGPAVFTAQLRALGDSITRLDRYEPDMMKVNATEVRDTTTPEAMAKTIGKMLTSNWLMPEARARLIEWMIETRTGLKRIRAGLPEGWRAGDKTGTGLGEAADIPDRYNDIAIIWPPNRPPIIVAAYYESSVRSENMREEDMAVLAQVGAIAARWALTA